MKVSFVDYAGNYLEIKNEIDAAVQDCLSSGNLILHEEVERFEENLKNYLGVSYAVAVHSGTDALILSLVAAGIGRGDQVITSSHTFWATIEAIKHVGAEPILTDIDEIKNNGLMGTSAIHALSEKTKAIIPVHIAGDMVNPQIIDVIRNLCKERYDHDLIIIEDAAQALGARIGGIKAGTSGLTGCFSFYPAKILGTYGDGGAVITNDEDIYNRIKALRNHGGKPNPLYVGYNSRLDNIQAAILNVKFKYLDKYIAQRKQIALMYNMGLGDIAELILPASREGRVYQDYIIHTIKREDLLAFLKTEGIETMPDKYPFMSDFKKPIFCNLWEDTGLRLPIHPLLTDDQIQYVIKTIRRFFAQ